MVVATIAFAAGAAAPPPANATLLYDVGFDSPPHVLGALPAEGGGAFPRQTVSDVWFGDPIVVEAVGALDDQPLWFHGGALLSTPQRYLEQIAFDVGAGAERYRLEFDVLVDRLETAADGFVIFLDRTGPAISRFEFRGDGLIQLGTGADFPGSFVEDVVIPVAVVADPVLDRWSIFVDGTRIHEGPWISDDLVRVRFALDEYSAELGNPLASVGLDNVRIHAIPEPAAAALVALGLLGLASRPPVGRT
jgi:hypothetical protein